MLSVNSPGPTGGGTDRDASLQPAQQPTQPAPRPPPELLPSPPSTPPFFRLTAAWRPCALCIRTGAWVPQPNARSPASALLVVTSPVTSSALFRLHVRRRRWGHKAGRTTKRGPGRGSRVPTSTCCSTPCAAMLRPTRKPGSHRSRGRLFMPGLLLFCSLLLLSFFLTFPRLAAPAPRGAERGKKGRGPKEEENQLDHRMPAMLATDDSLFACIPCPSYIRGCPSCFLVNLGRPRHTTCPSLPFASRSGSLP